MAFMPDFNDVVLVVLASVTISCSWFMPNLAFFVNSSFFTCIFAAPRVWTGSEGLCCDCMEFGNRLCVRPTMG